MIFSGSPPTFYVNLTVYSNMSISKGIKYTSYILIGSLVGLYIGLIVLLNIPYIQKRTAHAVAKELSERLNTNVEVGRINMGLLNRIVIDNVQLKDQQNNNLLFVNKLSTKFDLLPLLKGKFMINSIQLFDFTANLNRPSPKEPTNFQFVLDAFASKDTVRFAEKPFRNSSRLVTYVGTLTSKGSPLYGHLSESGTLTGFGDFPVETIFSIGPNRVTRAEI